MMETYYVPVAAFVDYEVGLKVEWGGGSTFNVYAIAHGEDDWVEVDVFSVFPQPLSRERASAEAELFFERARAELEQA